MQYSAEFGAFMARAGHVVVGPDVRISPLHILGMGLIADLPRQLVLLGGTLLVCFTFAQIFERNLGALRAALLRMRDRFPGPRQSQQPRPG